MVEKEPARDRRELSVILYNWIPNLEEYFNTMETDFETNNPEIDLVIISLPGYYDGLDKTEADVYTDNGGASRTGPVPTSCSMTRTTRSWQE